jgi:hypothetical protein
MFSVDLKKVRRHCPGVRGIRSRSCGPGELYVAAVQDLEGQEVEER